MKYLYLNIVCLLLVTSSSWTQNSKDPIMSTREWENTVDYVNAKIIYLYIEEYIDKGTPSDPEIASFNLYKSALDSQTINDPMDSERLSALLGKYWPKTINQISEPIKSFKNLKDKSPTILFQKVDSLLKARRSEITLGNSFGQLKEKIIGNNKKTDAAEEQQKMNVATNNQVSSDRLIDVPNQNASSSLYLYMIVPAFLFMLSTLFFFWKFRKKNKENNKLEKERERLDGLIKLNKTKISEKEKTIDDLKKEIDKLQLAFQSITNQNTRIEQIKDGGPTEVSFTKERAEKTNLIFYAGKPSVGRVFTETFEQPQESKTIFKLTVNSNNQENAEFEICDVSDFMIKSITNIPDDYLYRVCNHENSNREFTKEIITTKKGKAELIDGNWTVREENKATIKFQ